MTEYQKIRGFGSNGTPLGDIVFFTEKPLECPFCHIGIETQPLAYVEFGINNTQVLLKCKSCRNAFVAYTNKCGGEQYDIRELSKGGKHKTSEFAKEINKISPAFVQIFGESEVAERENLMQICGVGYRKALEFLIKDYLIETKPDKKDSIEKKFLGKCINDYIDDKKIKEIAEKATWLGNDETHYVRKWEDKDLSDLKTLISITLYYILMEIQANKYISEMKK